MAKDTNVSQRDLPASEPVLRSAYIPHKRCGKVCEGPSMTRQEFADECDINQIMAKYEKAGVWPPPANGAEPKYFDAGEFLGLQDAMNAMIDANEAFMRLPAVTRKEFDNDAIKFVEFAQDPKNVGKMREWGLAEPEKAPIEPLAVRVVPDTPPSE